MEMLWKVMFPPPSSLLVSVMSVASLVGVAGFGLCEVLGIHLQYSKFWTLGAQNSIRRQPIKLSSRTGMLLLYTPAFLFGVASFLLFPDGDLRLLLVQLTVTLHFFKRDLEVLFVHKYSGGTVLDSVLAISLSYFVASSMTIYSQYLTQGSPEPQMDLKYPGILLFLVGIIGNFYHHLILASLRKDGKEGYKIPKGGLFGLVICPHYLFEILVFIGITFISQTLYALCFTIGTVCYLVGRSYVTRKWYLSKFEDFPSGVKALIPYVF
ncbi:hypothetical protein Tsubulata_051333 [Turnera subulata]|uniref:3-oxo-5-alpha-steroid 4-dehydrogenase C-terminal domain-containing protein n=1 Tax=Turnera subulata TaxID=218843 RepID=A0A9Q0G8Q3_9ROSI|nr:hypothetical protein Tsubulata_051333 [Turnera subulata]